MQELIYQHLKKIKKFPSKDESYSPLFSSIGLCVRPDVKGLGKLWFNYNRASRSVFDRLVDMPYALNNELSCIYELVFGNGEARLAFWKNDAFMLDIDGDNEIRLCTEASKKTLDIWIDYSDKEFVCLKGQSINPEKRDPDYTVPFVFGIRALTGTLSTENGIVATPKKGKLVLAFAFEALKARTSGVRNILNVCPESEKNAALLCRRWVRNYSASFAPEVQDEETAEITAYAIRGLLFNATKAQGNLEGHISPFPSRGRRPCTYLWDTYFQNFGYSLLGSDLNKDFLRQIAKCMRTDGKFPQFMCSTWEKPHETQPALFGWAVMNAIGDSYDFAWEMLPIIEANNEWWLSAKMTQRGLVLCSGGNETGQSNSPRFDNGPTLAVDMNSYLLNQLRMTAQIERMLGLEDKAKRWDEKADMLSENIMKHLFSKNDYMFYDMNPVIGERIKVITPSSFLPLWAGVNIDKKYQDKILKKYLLSVKHFMGEVPFPTVSYDDKRYDPADWWRGPTWIPTSWLMLETLEKLGLEKEREAAAEKLWNLLIKDKKMHGLFNSKTGEGMGSEQQGWTCGIFLRLLAERQK